MPAHRTSFCTQPASLGRSINTHKTSRRSSLLSPHARPPSFSQSVARGSISGARPAWRPRLRSATPPCALGFFHCGLLVCLWAGVFVGGASTASEGKGSLGAFVATLLGCGNVASRQGFSCGRNCGAPGAFDGGCVQYGHGAHTRTGPRSRPGRGNVAPAKPSCERRP